MQLGTYKFIKHPNQYQSSFLYRIKALLKEFWRRVTIVTALMAIATFFFIAGQLSTPEHIEAFTTTNTITKTVLSTDFPILEHIADCESGTGKAHSAHQFKPNGDIVRGKVNPSDIGKYQINEYINNDLARKLGFDIFTEQGNHDMAVYLFINQGTNPWNSSKACWSK